MDNKEKKRVSEQIAENVIMPINQTIDIALAIRPHLVEEMRERLSSMRDRETVLCAFPTPETMKQGELLRIDNDLFEAIIILVEKRVTQREEKLKAENSTTPGEEILSQLGFNP